MAAPSEGAARPRLGAVGDPENERAGERLGQTNNPSPGGNQRYAAALHDKLILLRDEALRALRQGANDYEACALSLENEDDAGAVHHFARLDAIVRSARQTMRDLRELLKQEGVHD